jgi:hypothetical protein
MMRAIFVIMAALGLGAYPWLGERDVQASAEPLVHRFAPPDGYMRVAEAEGSFGAFLRTLPLAPKGTPVTTYRGELVREGDDEYVAAVVALDQSHADLQQCADSVIRLHAEWLWSRGRRDASYEASSGAPMPFARWMNGERAVAKGTGLAWQKSRVAGGRDHDAYRAWLDDVFAYANTVSLARTSKSVMPADLRAGDFFIHPGWPGHVVLVLDVARDTQGHAAVLLGQGYMPAQSFHLMRPSRESPWFRLDPEAPVTTPFWREFEWSELRRLD